MSGCRSLTKHEVEQLDNYYSQNGKTFRYRDLCLFRCGIYLGFRIKELLSFKVEDVWNFDTGKPASVIYIEPKNMKKRNGRGNLSIHPNLQWAIQFWVSELQTKQDVVPHTLLFQSREGGLNRAISIMQASRILKAGFQHCGLDGKLATHTLRKTAAIRYYKVSGNDIYATKEFLGHRDVTSTQHYLASEQHDIGANMMKMDEVDY